jgi:hypothetical protein
MNLHERAQVKITVCGRTTFDDYLSNPKRIMSDRFQPKRISPGAKAGACESGPAKSACSGIRLAPFLIALYRIFRGVLCHHEYHIRRGIDFHDSFGHIEAISPVLDIMASAVVPTLTRRPNLSAER